MRLAALLALAIVLAGCSDGGDPGAASASPDEFDDLGLRATATTGILLGVVVDDTIRPLAGAAVDLAVPGGGNRTATTDGEGRFAFGGLEPGSYLLRASLLNHQAAQTTAQVEAGVDDPPVVRVQLARLYSQEPYSVPQKIEGFIQCGYAVGGVMSSVCLNDYTHFVGPYTCRECEHILDRRGGDFSTDAGWQTMVFEMDWTPSAQGTSPEMRLTVSHFPRPASHWYCGGAGTSPVLVRMEVGVVCEDQQDEPELVPPEGELNMTLFGAANAPDGQPAAVAWSQQFTVYVHQFYHGKPPEGWSFVAGDQPPF